MTDDVGVVRIHIDVPNPDQSDPITPSEQSIALADEIVFRLLEVGMVVVGGPAFEFDHRHPTGRMVGMTIAIDCEMPDSWTEEDREELSKYLRGVTE
jgi:hypothetical protein